VRRAPRARPSLRSLAILAATLLLLTGVASQVDTAALWRAARSLPPAVVAGFLALYFALNAARALRFRLLILSRDVPLGQLYPVTLVHNALAQLLVFRTGELSFPWLARRRLAVPVAESLGSLLLARLLDVAVIVLVGTTALAVRQDARSDAGAVPWPLLAGVVLAPLLAIWLAGPLARGLAARLPQWLPWERLRASRSMAGLVRGLSDSSRHLDRLRTRRRIAGLALLSLLVYALSLGCNLLVLVGLGVPGSLAALVLATSTVALAGSLPVSFSGFGVVEASWGLTLSALTELDLGEALALGFVLHAVQLVGVAVSGAAGLLLLRRARSDGLPAAAAEATEAEAVR
jgi:uncharacterized membrane protein YbhN (UPF0104 family)